MSKKPSSKRTPAGRRPGGRPGSQDSKAQTANSRREQLRAQRAAAERRRKRTMRIITVLGAVVLVAVIAIVSVVSYNQWKDKKDAAAARAAKQITPPGLNAQKTGYVIAKATVANAPTLVIYQDFQCPACKLAEDDYGDTIRALAKSGKVNIELRVLTIIDQMQNNDSSQKASEAAACAATVGKFEPYHDVVFANQPAQEGTGYTDQQLRDEFAQQAGIEGADLTKFQACVSDRATQNFATTMAKNAFDTEKVHTTPTYTVNGKNPKWDATLGGKAGKYDWWRTIQSTDEQAWLDAITKAAAS